MIYSLKFQSKSNSTRFFFCILLTAMMISIPFSSQQVFATHLSDEMKWQTVFISSRGCSLQNYQMLNLYDKISEKYLEMYGLDSLKYEPQCMPESEYLSDYQPPNDLDLVILIYDKELGEKLLHSQKMGGLYSHTGSDRNYNHVIIICDCSNFYYSDPVWILSHELSHFVLYYRNYEMSIIEDLIHANDAQYDKCIEGGANCESYVEKIELDSLSSSFSVMPILQPVKSSKTGTDTSNEKIRTSVIGISKMITKWWAADKISNGDYANAIGYLVDSDILPSNENTEILIADDPLSDEITWQEKFSEINANYRGVNTINSNNQNNIQFPNSDSSIIENKITFVEQVVLGLPDWFKTTAGWWAQDKITNEEFKKNIQYLVKTGIIRPHSSDVFKGVLNENETLLESSLQKVLEDVKSLINSKNLSDSDGNILINQLNLAIKKFDFDNTRGGCNQLDKFIEEVSLLVDNEKLVSKEAHSLINSVDLVKLNFCQ